MRRIVALFSVILLVTLFDAGAALGAANGTDRPYQDSGSAVLSIDLATLQVALAGTRNATHLGLSTSSATDVVADITTLPLVGVTFDDTITAANGDELHTTATATIDITPILTGGNTLPFSDVETITGGTGRFEGASGTFSSTGSVVLDLSTGTGLLTFQSTGTVSY